MIYVGSCSLYYSKFIDFSFRASVMVRNLARSSSTLFCWLKKGRERGLPMSMMCAFPMETSYSMD